MSIKVTVYLLSGKKEEHLGVDRTLVSEGRLSLLKDKVYGQYGSVVSYPLTALEKWEILA